MTDALTTGNYTAIDTETTGLSPATNEIIEIGAVRFRGFVPVEEFDILIKPRYGIPSFIEGLTGISPYMVENRPYIEEIAQDFLDFIGDDDIVGHNISFDLSFLQCGGIPVKDLGLVFYDTMKLGRQKLKKGTDIENHKLSVMCDYYGISMGRAHRAADDARATGRLFKKLVTTSE